MEPCFGAGMTKVAAETVQTANFLNNAMVARREEIAAAEKAAKEAEEAWTEEVYKRTGVRPPPGSYVPPPQPKRQTSVGGGPGAGPESPASSLQAGAGWAGGPIRRTPAKQWGWGGGGVGPAEAAINDDLNDDNGRTYIYIHMFFSSSQPKQLNRLYSRLF